MRPRAAGPSDFSTELATRPNPRGRRWTGKPADKSRGSNSSNARRFARESEIMSNETSEGEGSSKKLREGAGPQGQGSSGGPQSKAPVGASNASLNSGQSQPPVGGSASGHTMATKRVTTATRREVVDQSRMTGFGRQEHTTQGDDPG